MSPILGIYASQDYVRIPPSSFESIATATGTGSSGTITFSSIPSTYQHLQLRILSRSTSAAATSDLTLQLNGVTGSANYKSHYLFGTGASTGAGADGSGTTNMFIGLTPADSEAANIFGVAIVDLADYNSATKNKTMRAISGHDKNGATGYIWLSSGMNLSTSAVTSLDVKLNAGNFATGTTISLYGIKGA